ncbi:MAG: hypothetical protein OXF06_03685 [Bacteroidetes bacterium]|nr:hypothetical protein [Bacteroidota bacterium]
MKSSTISPFNYFDAPVQLTGFSELELDRICEVASDQTSNSIHIIQSSSSYLDNPNNGAGVMGESHNSHYLRGLYSIFQSKDLFEQSVTQNSFIADDSNVDDPTLQGLKKLLDSLRTARFSSANQQGINFDPLPQILDANFHEEIINVMSLSGFDKIATRLGYLYQIIQDSDDPDDPEMSFKSLQNLAIFFVKNSTLFPDPDIGVDPEGLLQAEWHLGYAAALINFRPDDLVCIAGTSSLNGPMELHDIQGNVNMSLASQMVRAFLDNLKKHANN